VTYWAVTPDGQVYMVLWEYDIPPEPVYGIGDMYAPVYRSGVDFGRTISPPRQNRVEKARLLWRDEYVKSLHACLGRTWKRSVDYGDVEYALDDEDKFQCGHAAHEHNQRGCTVILDWDDDNPIYCGCEGYVKPAPLMKVPN